MAVSTTSIFDPVTNTFSAGPNTAYFHLDPAAVTLPNGKVILIGDSNGGAENSAAELFDPVANSFTKIPGANVQKGWNAAILLNNGKVLSTGPFSGTNSTAELYDPVLNTWTSGGVMLISKQDINMTLLPSGKVLVPGGWNNNASAETNESEIYDPTTNTWTATPNLGTARIYTGLAYTPLNNKILIGSGGLGGTTVTEYYTPAADMPVSTHDYKQNETYTRTNLGSLNGIQFKKPKIAVNSSGDATIA